MELSSGHTVIGRSGGAQWYDAVNVEKSGESGEARRWAVRVSVVKEHLCAALTRESKCTVHTNAWRPY